MRQSREDLILNLSSLIASCEAANDKDLQEDLLDLIVERITEYKKSKLESKKDRIAMQDYFKEILN